MNFLPINFNSCAKPLAHFPNAKRSFSFGSCYKSLVLFVYGSRCIAQIRNAVVGFNPIDVVNFVGWPSLVNVEPRQPMSQVSNAIQIDTDVPVIVQTPGDGASRYPRSNGEMGKIARFWVVVRDFKQTTMGDKLVCCTIAISHATLRSQLVRAGATFARFLGPLILRHRMVMCNG